MSTQPCGCQCRGLESVSVAGEGMAFDPVMPTDPWEFPAPMLILAMVTAALTLARQTHRDVPLSIREPATTPVRETSILKSRLRLSRGEKRVLASAGAILRGSGRIWRRDARAFPV